VKIKNIPLSQLVPSLGQRSENRQQERHRRTRRRRPSAEVLRAMQSVWAGRIAHESS
jgi:hypothetical protein